MDDYKKYMADEAQPRATRSSAEARREQLLAIARKIIETEGVEALRPTRVAELAGCTRPLIYQYFPKREDMFIAITEEMYRMAEDASDALGARTIPDAAAGDSGPARALVESFWAYLDEKGPSALILRSTPEISAEFRVYLERLKESYEIRWRKGFLDLGLDDAHADFMLELFLRTMKVLAMQHLAGQIDRETAIERHLETTAGLLQGALRASQSQS